jgi:general secretion pathway protein N
MTARLAPSQIAMIVLCLLMAALFVYQLSAEPSDYVLPEIHLKPRAMALTAPEPFQPPPMSVYDAINDRPLFLPSRKPIAAPAAAGTAAAPAGPPPLPAVTLVGVLLGGGNSVAEIKTNGAAFSQAMRVGDTLGGWQIAAIGPDHITLRSGGYSQDVRMDAHANSPPPGAPGAPPAPNAPPGAAQ